MNETQRHEFDPRNLLEEWVRYDDALRGLTQAGLTVFSEQVARQESPAGAGTAWGSEEDMQSLQKLNGLVQCGFNGLRRRSVTVGDERAQASFALPEDIDPGNSRHLNFGPTGSRVATEYVLNIETVEPNSPTGHSVYGGSSPNLELVVGTGGIRVSVSEQQVRVHPRTEDIVFQPQIGMQVTALENGEIFFRPAKFISGMALTPERPINLTHICEGQGNKLIDSAKDALAW